MMSNFLAYPVYIYIYIYMEVYNRKESDSKEKIEKQINPKVINLLNDPSLFYQNLFHLLKVLMKV